MVDAAIAAAQLRVDRFTAWWWEPRTATVVADLGGNGSAVLPRQIDATAGVTVRYVGATADLPSTAYTVRSSRTPGQYDGILLGLGYADPLIAGAEPWSGGWQNLVTGNGALNPLASAQVQVTGTFGEASVPAEVVAATAQLAAAITAGGIPLPVAGGAPPAGVDAEGDTLVVEAPTVQATESPDTQPTRTTGLAAADAILAPLQHRRVRFS